MKKLGIVGDLLAAVFVIAIIYVLVRPRSAAVDMITQFSKALTALVQTATDI